MRKLNGLLGALILMMSVTITKPRTLTKEEEDQLYAFIGKASLKRVVFTTNLAYKTKCNISDICEMQISEIQSIGEFVSNMKEGGWMRTSAPMFGCFSKEEALNFLTLLYMHRQYEIQSSLDKAELEAVDAELENLQTPEERKAKLLARKAELS